EAARSRLCRAVPSRRSRQPGGGRLAKAVEVLDHHVACESLHFVPRAAAEAMARRVEAPGGARELERPLEREPAGEAGGEAGGEGVSRTAGIRRLDLGCGHADETVVEHSERRLFGPR